MILAFHVPGIPATKGSARAFAFRRTSGKLGAAVVNDNPRGKAWTQAVALMAKEAANRNGMHEPIARAVHVSVQFCFERPKSHYGGSRLRPSAPIDATSHRIGDIDKLCRCLLDGLTGTVVADDALVVKLEASKAWACANEAVGAYVRVSEVGAAVTDAA